MLISEVSKNGKNINGLQTNRERLLLNRQTMPMHSSKNKKSKRINSHITIKQDLLHKGNEIKLHPQTTQENLGLKKLPTEKQTQAYIDETYKDVTDDYAISKENINVIKKELELIDDEIQMWKYIIQMELKE